MRPFIGSLLLLVLATGCGPAVPPEDLGTVLDKLPAVPGADKPYELPELNPPPAGEPEPAGPDAGS